MAYLGRETRELNTLFSVTDDELAVKGSNQRRSPSASDWNDLLRRL